MGRLCAHASAVSTQFSTVVAETSGRRGHCPPCPAGLGGNLLLHPLHRPPLGSCRRQYLPPVLVEVKLPNVSGTGQRVEKHLTCRVVSRRRDLYEVGVSHVLLRSNLPADRALYRERGTLTLPLRPRSGSMNPASLAQRAPVPGVAARRPSIGSGQSISAYLAGRPFAGGHS